MNPPDAQGPNGWDQRVALATDTSNASRVTEIESAVDTLAEAVSAAAWRLLDAADRGEPCRPVRDLIGSTDLDAAYAVQRRVTDERIRRGARLVGRKIGLTSEAVQRQMGVSQPDLGVLFEDMWFNGGDTIPWSAVLQPRAEAEIAFRLGADLAEGELDIAQVRAAVEYAVVAIEVCGSRIQDWDISFADTVADNASSGVFVLGPQHRSLDSFEPRESTMSMTATGQEPSSGQGSACLGDPLRAVQWLARTARDLGDPLRAGQLVLSGALGPMLDVVPGARVRAEVAGLGRVVATFGENEER